jgi:hypothetical protein
MNNVVNHYLNNTASLKAYNHMIEPQLKRAIKNVPPKNDAPTILLNSAQNNNGVKKHG